jgi:hypothetical protein
MAGPCRIPKLTVRVRFPSPAPHAKSVAAQSNWTIPLFGLCVSPVHVRATLGHTYPHLGTHPSASEDAQLVPLCSPTTCSRILPTSPKGCPRHDYELDVTGSTTTARKETSDPGPRARALDADMPVRLTIGQRCGESVDEGQDVVAHQDAQCIRQRSPRPSAADDSELAVRGHRPHTAGEPGHRYGTWGITDRRLRRTRTTGRQAPPGSAGPRCGRSICTP